MKAGLPHSSNSGAASVELNHPKACSFSHGAMQNLGGGRIEVPWGRTDSLAVWVGTQKDRRHHRSRLYERGQQQRKKWLL